MKKRDKIFVVFALYFWFAVGLFFFNSFLFAILPAAGMVWFFLGGKKHV